MENEPLTSFLDQRIQSDKEELLRKCRDRIQTLYQEIELERQLKIKAQQQSRKFKQKISNLQDSIDELQVRTDFQSTELQESEKSNIELKKELYFLKQSLNETIDEKQEAEQLKGQLEQKFQKQQQTIYNLKRELDCKQLEIDEWNSTLDNVQSKLHNITQENETLKDQIDQINQQSFCEKEQLEKQNQDLRDQMEEVLNESRIKPDLSFQNCETMRLIDQQQDELNQLKDEIQKLQYANQDLMSINNAKENQVQMLQNEIKKLSERNKSLEIQIQEAFSYGEYYDKFLKEQEKVSKLEKEIDAVYQSNQQFEESNNKAYQKLEQAIQDSKQKEKDNNNLCQELQQIKTALKESSDYQHQLQQNFTKLQQEYQSLKRNSSNKKQEEQESYRQEMQEKQKEIEMLQQYAKSQIDQLKKDHQQQIQETKTYYQNYIDQNSGQLQKYKDYYKQYKDQYESLVEIKSQENTELQSEKFKLYDVIKELEFGLVTLKNSYEQLSYEKSQYHDLSTQESEVIENLRSENNKLWMKLKKYQKIAHSFNLEKITEISQCESISLATKEQTEARFRKLIAKEQARVQFWQKKFQEELNVIQNLKNEYPQIQTTINEIQLRLEYALNDSAFV